MLTVAKAIPMGRGQPKLLPGTDVTAEAKSWKNLRMLLLRGYLSANPPVNAPRVVPRGSAPTPKASSPGGGGGQLVALADLTSSNTKREIRATLEASGFDASPTLSKGELLALRDAEAGGTG
jgi:hypothetical protein